MSNLQQDLQRRFPQIADRFQIRDDKLTLLDNGVPVAVLLTPTEMEGLEITLELMSDPEAAADIREAEEAYGAGDIVEDEAEIRKLIYRQSAKSKERGQSG